MFSLLVLIFLFTLVQIYTTKFFLVVQKLIKIVVVLKF